MPKKYAICKHALQFLNVDLFRLLCHDLLLWEMLAVVSEPTTYSCE